MPPEDPKLLAAVRHAYVAQQKDPTITPDDLDAFIREETAGKFGHQDYQRIMQSMDGSLSARNVGRSVAQGGLFDFADELTGLLPSSMGGGDAAKEEMRLRGTMFQHDHPVADAVGKVGGAVGSMLATDGVTGLLGEAAQGARGLWAVARGAGVGAGAGFAQGMGAGEGSATDRLPGAEWPTVVGGVLGAAFPALAPALQRFTSPAVRGARSVARAIDQSGGADAVRASLQKMTDAGRGGVAMLGDLSPQLRAATDKAANNSEDVFTKLFPAVKARQADATERVLGDVRTGAGDHFGDKIVDDLKKSTASWADGPNGFGGIRDANPTVDVSHMAPYLQKPGVKDAWQLAQRAGNMLDTSAPEKVWTNEMMDKLLSANPGMTEETAGNTLGAAGFSPPDAGRPVAFADLHQFKRILNGRAGKAFASGDGDLGKAFATIRDAVDEGLQDQVPAYADVSAQYAHRKSLEKAVQSGMDAFGASDSRGLAAQMGNFATDAEREHFRQGMASSLIKTLRNASTNRGEADKLMAMSPAYEDKIKAVFPDQATFERFMANTAEEAQLHAQLGSVGGSATHRRGAAAEAPDMLETGARAVTGHESTRTALLRSLERKLFGARRAATSGAAGPMLMTQGTQGISDMLRNMPGLLEQPAGRTLGTILPGASSRLGGLLASPFDR